MKVSAKKQDGVNRRNNIIRRQIENSGGEQAKAQKTSTPDRYQAEMKHLRENSA